MYNLIINNRKHSILWNELVDFLHELLPSSHASDTLAELMHHNNIDIIIYNVSIRISEAV